MEEKTVMRLDQVKIDFANHLNDEGNKFVVFSGAYGIGKTHFLKEFFAEQEAYHHVLISPVKYILSPSENIFELIKIDVAKNLFAAGYLSIEQPVEDLVTNMAGQTIKKRTLPFLKHILKSIAKVHPMAGVASMAADGIHALMEDFETFKGQYNETFKLEDPDVQLTLFLEGQYEQKGHFWERNVVTESIEKALDHHRGKDEKPWVLVVDDFDRLDPEHIFRMLNVMSAHQDDDGTSFKFGFDKVILVFDYENLRHLYHHRYGPQANFKGYIDKFYSREVFHFSHEDVISDYLKKIIDYDFSPAVEEVILGIVSSLFATGKLTMRQIDKAKGFQAVAEDFEMAEFEIEEKLVKVFVRDVPMLQIFPLLSRMAGSYTDMKLWMEEYEHKTVNKSYAEVNQELFEQICLPGLAVRGTKNFHFQQKFRTSPNYYHSLSFSQYPVQRSKSFVDKEKVLTFDLRGNQKFYLRLSPNQKAEHIRSQMFPMIFLDFLASMESNRKILQFIPEAKV